jgi:hypothetical protein
MQLKHLIWLLQKAALKTGDENPDLFVVGVGESNWRQPVAKNILTHNG